MSDTIDIKVRTTEAATREVFVDVNDLIIELMMDEQNANSQVEKDAIRRVINKLTELRKVGHERAQRD